jgi:hypothetical protein
MQKRDYAFIPTQTGSLLKVALLFFLSHTLSAISRKGFVFFLVRTTPFLYYCAFFRGIIGIKVSDCDRNLLKSLFAYVLSF